MQPFVYSVFVFVVSVIATLLVAGLTGIITLLLVNRQPAPLLAGHEPEADRSVNRVVQSPRVSSAPRESVTDAFA